MNMKRFLSSLVLSLVILFSFSLVAPAVKAATTGEVSATVTVINLAVSVTDGTVAYLTISAGDTEDTTTPAVDGGVDDSQTATNDGNVLADFNITGTDSTNWTLAGTAGSETFTHKWCTTSCDEASPTWTAITTGYTSLATSIAASGGTQVFDLQMGTPTTTTNFTEQTATVTIQIVEHA